MSGHRPFSDLVKGPTATELHRRSTLIGEHMCKDTWKPGRVRDCPVCQSKRPAKAILYSEAYPDRLE